MKHTLNLVSSLLVIVLLIGLGFFSYWAWQLERKLHYSWSYKSMVEQTVREMVKPEALKQGNERLKIEEHISCEGTRYWTAEIDGKCYLVSPYQNDPELGPFFIVCPF